MLQVASSAPEFTMQAVMPDGEFKEVKLSDYKGKWVVLFFYPLDFTFVCPTEITAFSKLYDQFKDLGAEVIGVSIDSVFSHDAWIKGSLGEIAYPLASDITKKVSDDYNVLLEDAGIALRGTFIIDPDGILQWQIVHSTGVGRSTEEVVRALKAIQTGDLCQADWSEGKDTLGKA